MSGASSPGFYAVAAVGAVVLVAAFLLARGPERRARLWRRLSRTGIVVVAVTIVGGLAGILFFDQAFELFHELFFPAGSYLFDPATEKLVQLFPQAFWIDSTIGVGAVVVALATGLWWLGRWRATALEARIDLRNRPRGRARPGGGPVSGGLPIARLFGIEIRVSFAWSVLIAVVTVIGAQQAAAGAPQLASAAHILVGGARRARVPRLRRRPRAGPCPGRPAPRGGGPDDRAGLRGRPRAPVDRGRAAGRRVRHRHRRAVRLARHRAARDPGGDVRRRDRDASSPSSPAACS